MSKIAIVFPGQGSQSIGMLANLAENFPSVKSTFAQASDALGYNLWDLIQEGPEEKLNQTQFTQAAMLTADVAVFRVLQQELTLSPAFMAGHSLGEYAALVCSGALKLAEAAQLVEKRGKFMQQTIPLGKGAMAAIVGLEDAQVREACEKAADANFQVTPANYNAVGQVVIAGHTSAVQKAMSIAEEMGARMVMMIPVSVPCHCPLLKSAAELFAKSLEQASFEIPVLPVISNVDLSIYSNPQQMRELLKAQLYSPVRWVETVQLMKQNGITHVIECGPGKVLSGLVKRIDKELAASAVNDLASVEKISLNLKELEGTQND